MTLGGRLVLGICFINTVVLSWVLLIGILRGNLWALVGWVFALSCAVVVHWLEAKPS